MFELLAEPDSFSLKISGSLSFEEKANLLKQIRSFPSKEKLTLTLDGKAVLDDHVADIIAATKAQNLRLIIFPKRSATTALSSLAAILISKQIKALDLRDMTIGSSSIGFWPKP